MGLGTFACRQPCRQSKNPSTNLLFRKELLPNLSRILFYGEMMKRYIFIEQEIENEYKYIFLCGAKYTRNDLTDKRNVLRTYLSENNSNFKPIILEDNFMFGKKVKAF